MLPTTLTQGFVDTTTGVQSAPLTQPQKDAVSKYAMTRFYVGMGTAAGVALVTITIGGIAKMVFGGKPKRRRRRG